MTWMRCPECDTRWNSEVVVIKELKNLCPNCGRSGIATNMTHALKDNYDYTTYLTPKRNKVITKSKIKRLQQMTKLQCPLCGTKWDSDRNIKYTGDLCPDCGTKGVSPEEYEVLQHYVKDSGAKGIPLSDYKKMYIRSKSRKSKPKAKGCGCK